MYRFRRPIASILVLLSVREEIGGRGLYKTPISSSIVLFPRIPGLLSLEFGFKALV
jgi:hypothetical protein